MVSARVLGGWIGISERRVRELAERNILSRSGNGRYPLRASIAAYCEHTRSLAASRSGNVSADLNLTHERALLAQEQRIGQQIKNAKESGELLPRQAVLERWSAILRSVSVRMRAVPTRARQRLAHLTADDVLILEEEVRDALTEAAGEGVPS